MSLELLDVLIMVAGALIGVAALALLRFKIESKEKKHYKEYSSFLLMGGLWSSFGLVFGVLYRGDGIFDAPLLSLGLIFLLAGGLGVIVGYFKH